MSTSIDVEFVQVGTGLTVFEQDGPVQGPVVWLDSPEAVLDFVASGAVSDTIVLARGGTTTFLVPALSAGVKAVMTLQGAPESHLGILSREYGIPCLMSVAFTEGVVSARGETIPPDGAIVRLDVSGSPEGRAYIASTDRDYGTAAAAGAAGEDPDAAAQAAQLAQLMAAYRGEISDGPTGDRQLRNRLRSGVLHNTPENIARDLRPEEIGDFLAYTGWNLWDLIKTRQTEGESGLIPRQEYETVGFVQQWATYAHWMDLITERIGVDGVVELGRIPRHEIGSKANHVRIWAISACPLIGKGIATALGHRSDRDERHDCNTIIQWMRRLQFGLWGPGPGYVSGRGYQVRVLDDEWITRFREEEHRLDDPDELSAFRAFNAATELSGFLLHYDCRAALCDTGPYPLPDGGFVIVRDHFLYETAHEWTDIYGGLPYCVTQAMFFRPDTAVRITINDIATTFAEPKNYLKHLSGVAVYARDRWDTPMSDIRKLDFAEMSAIVDKCNAAMLELYTTIAGTPRDQRIRNGVKVYHREMFLPYARRLGVWEEMTAAGFDTLAPLTEAVYPVLTGGSGEAQQALGAVFLMGQGVVPESGLGHPPQIGPEAFESLHALAICGRVVELPDATALIDAELVRSTRLGYLLTSAGRSRHQELLQAERTGLDLDDLATVYDRFLSVNRALKAAATAFSTADSGDRPDFLGQIGRLVDRAEPLLRRTAEQVPRFAGYADRLSEALAKADKGDWEYVNSPRIDSVHTVWMQIHEDYLQVLERDRAAEGSF